MIPTNDRRIPDPALSILSDRISDLASAIAQLDKKVEWLSRVQDRQIGAVTAVSAMFAVIGTIVGWVVHEWHTR
jgi:hypothetical protein